MLLLRLREGAAVSVGGEVAAEVVPPRRPVDPAELPPLVREARAGTRRGGRGEGSERGTERVRGERGGDDSVEGKRGM